MVRDVVLKEGVLKWVTIRCGLKGRAGPMEWEPRRRDVNAIDADDTIDAVHDAGADENGVGRMNVAGNERVLERDRGGLAMTGGALVHVEQIMANRSSAIQQSTMIDEVGHLML